MTSPLAPRAVVAVADTLPRPWLNGGGSARDLLMWPSADDWRVSVGLADIEADGPFSSYPKVQRVFAIVAGGGVRLSIGGALHDVRPEARDGLVFDGGAVTTCRRLGGTTTALNLMTRGTAGTIKRLAAGATWAPRSPACGIFTLKAGTCRFVDEEVEVPGNALLWFDLAPPILTFSRDAWALEVGKTTSSAAARR